MSSPEKLLESNKQETRLQAFEGLDDLENEKLWSFLIEALKHWDRKIRYKSTIILAEKFGTRALKPIKEAISSSRISARFGLQVICKIDDADAISYAEYLWSQPNIQLPHDLDEIIRKQLNYYSTLLTWEVDDRLSSQAAARLRKVDKEIITAFIAKLSAHKRNALLADPVSFIFINEYWKPEKEKPDVAKTDRYSVPNMLKAISEVLTIQPKMLGILIGSWPRFDDNYTEFKIKKRDGSFRTLAAPKPVLKHVQRAIYDKVLVSAELNDACHGFRKAHSIKSNASGHTSKDVVINLDLKDFFPTVSASRVYGIYRSLGIDEKTCRIYTRLTTYKGCLPQGAPTSPVLANLSCRRMDSRLSGLAKDVGASYSRYADDITFSGGVADIGCLKLIQDIIAEEGFTIAEKKKRITRKGNRQEVTGLTVNERVTIPRRRRRLIRAVMHRIQNGKKAVWKGKKMTGMSLQGHLSFLGSVHPDLAKKYFDQLDNSNNKPRD